MGNKAKRQRKKKKRRVKKQARAQKKVKKAEKRERKRFLGSYIENRKIKKECAEFDAAVDQLSYFINDLNKFILGYQQLISVYQRKKFPDFEQQSGAYSGRIVNDFKKIFDWADWAKGFIEEEIDDVKTFSENIDKEDKALKKEREAENKLLRRLRRSASKGGGLDEKKKAAIVKKKQQLNEKIRTYQKLLKDSGKVITEVLEKDLEEINNLIEQRKKIKQKWQKKSTSWKGLIQLLGELSGMMGNKRQFVINLKIRNRKILIASFRQQKFLKGEKGPYKKKEILDKEFMSLMLQEEMALSHDKHMGDIVDAL